MLIEDGKYISEYFGIFRDILVKQNQVKIIFNALLNDDLNFTYVRKYSSEQEARDKIENFIEESKYLEEPLSYDLETVHKVNESIHSLISDILIENVHLPDEQYEFIGDKSYLKTLSDKKIEFVFFD